MRAWSNRGFLAVWAAALLAGCIDEDLPACPTPHEIHIRVASSVSGCSDELPDTAVDTATLFLFDDKGLLRELKGISRDALVRDEPVELQYCGTCRPRAVVWGNLATCPVTLPVPGETLFGDFRIGMRTSGEYASVPDNLYYGLRDLTADRVQYILISPAMGRLTVTARGLGFEEVERYFFLLETQIDGYDFLRTPLPGKRTIRLDAARRASTGDLTSGDAIPLFAYPKVHDGIEPIHIALYRLREDGAHLVGRTDFDDKLHEIVPQAGRCVNVMMDFRAAGGAGIDIDIRITPWEVVELWENW